MDALENRQEQLTQWVKTLQQEYVVDLTPNDAEILLSYSGKFNEGRYLITGSDGVEVDPLAISPNCVADFWRRIAGCFQALMDIPLDCPDILQESRAILPYLQSDALAAAERGNTDWVNYRKPQIGEYQAKLDLLIVPAIKAEVNRNKGRAAATQEKAMEMWKIYQHGLRQGKTRTQAREHVTANLGISKATFYRLKNRVEKQQPQ